jgi:pantothenate synthetase
MRLAATRCIASLAVDDVVDPVEMKPVERARADSVVIVAARVGPTRLIDNMILGEGT